MNNKQLLTYTHQTHGKTTTRKEIRYADYGLYQELWKRQLTHSIPRAPRKNGKERREEGTLGKMTDKQLLTYTHQTHGKTTTRSELDIADGPLYQELLERQLLHHFPLAPRKNGKERKEPGTLGKMTDKQLLTYTHQTHGPFLIATDAKKEVKKIIEIEAQRLKELI